MRTKTKTLTAIAVAAALGGAALAGASYANHRGGLNFPDGGQFAAGPADMFAAFDADGDGELSQAEVDKLRGDLLAAHDADSDGSLNLEEFSGLWQEATRPLTVRAFQSLDTDGDGVVTRAEYDRPLAGIVERLDRDGSGTLSIREGWDDDDDDDDDSRGRWWDND